MTITIETILLVLFLVPGILFTRGYYTSPFAKKFSKSTVFGEISWCIIFSMLMHLMGMMTVYLVNKYSFGEFNRIMDFILNMHAGEARLTMSSLNSSFIIKYTIFLWIFSFLLGFITNRIIRRSQLDKHLNGLGFDNQWYYYFSGESLELPSIGAISSDEVDFVIVNILTTVNDIPTLYTGICVEYYLDKDGGLSGVFLTGTHKMQYNSDGSEGSYDRIFGRYLMVPSKEILNINYRYYRIKNKVDFELRKTRFNRFADSLSNVKAGLENLVLIWSFAALIISMPNLLFKKANSPLGRWKERMQAACSFFGLFITVYFSYKYGTVPNSYMWGIVTGTIVYFLGITLFALDKSITVRLLWLSR